jgi:hypothetical protein
MGITKTIYDMKLAGTVGTKRENIGKTELMSF